MKVLLWSAALAIAIGGAACDRRSDGAGTGRAPEATGVPAEETAGGAVPEAEADAPPPAARTPIGDDTAVPAEPVPVSLQTPADTVGPVLGYLRGATRGVGAELSHATVEGNPVTPGMLLVTDPGSRAEIDLPDGSVVDLDEMTEVLVRDATRHGTARRIHLELLSGAIRVRVEPNAAAGSFFRVSAAAGTIETEEAEQLVEIVAEGGAADLIVTAGRATVKAGDAERAVTAADGSSAAVRITSAPAIEPLAAPAGTLERWDDWDDRQADDLLQRYGIDIGRPETSEVPELQADLQPLWRPQIELRRARISSRVAQLVEALGAEEIERLETPEARLAAAREAWARSVPAARRTRLEAVHGARLDAWTAGAGARAARHADLQMTLGALRAAWARHQQESRGVKPGEDGTGRRPSPEDQPWRVGTPAMPWDVPPAPPKDDR